MVGVSEDKIFYDNDEAGKSIMRFPALFYIQHLCRGASGGVSKDCVNLQTDVR